MHTFLKVSNSTPAAAAIDDADKKVIFKNGALFYLLHKRNKYTGVVMPMYSLIEYSDNIVIII